MTTWNYLKRFTCFAIVGLMSFSWSASAEWVNIAGPLDGGIKAYANPSTIRRSGHIVKLWNMYDLDEAKTIRDITFLSVKAQEEFDCNEKKIKLLALSKHSLNMGAGYTVENFTYDSKNWDPVLLNSLQEKVFMYVCSKH